MKTNNKLNSRTSNTSITILSILILLMAANISIAVPVEKWNRTYGGPYHDGAYSVQQTSNGDYVFAGKTEFDYSSSGAWVVKTNSQGKEQWNKTYTFGTPYSSASYIQQTLDNGYIIAGASGGAAHDLGWLIKTDSYGKEQWNKSIDNSICGPAQQISDGSYVLACHHGAFDPILLVKIDQFGKEQWNKALSLPVGDFGIRSIQQTPDKGYMLAGYGYNYSYGYIGWLAKVDSNGIVQWDKSFIPEVYYGRTTSDGGYILTGTNCHPVCVPVLIKTDANGEEIWNKTFGNNLQSAFSVQQTLDNGYIIGGANYNEEWLIKTNSNGIEQWNMTFPGERMYTISAVSVSQTSDDGYILAGFKRSKIGDEDAWLIKVSKDKK